MFFRKNVSNLNIHIEGDKTVGKKLEKNEGNSVFYKTSLE